MGCKQTSATPAPAWCVELPKLSARPHSSRGMQFFSICCDDDIVQRACTSIMDNPVASAVDTPPPPGSIGIGRSAQYSSRTAPILGATLPIREHGTTSLDTNFPSPKVFDLAFDLTSPKLTGKSLIGQGSAANLKATEVLDPDLRLQFRHDPSCPSPSHCCRWEHEPSRCDRRERGSWLSGWSMLIVDARGNTQKTSTGPEARKGPRYPWNSIESCCFEIG